MAIQNCPLQPLHNQPFLGSSSAELLRANVPVYLQGMVWDTISPGPAPYSLIYTLLSTSLKPTNGSHGNGSQTWLHLNGITHLGLTPDLINLWGWIQNVACLTSSPDQFQYRQPHARSAITRGRHQKQMGIFHKALAPAEVRPQS